MKKSIALFLCIVLSLSLTACGNSMSVDSSQINIDAAEKYVNQQVYISLGITCEKYDSDVIYKSENRQLTSVKFYTEGASRALGSYCVYCVNGYVISSTGMNHAEYPYEDNIEELKALFGI